MLDFRKFACLIIGVAIFSVNVHSLKAAVNEDERIKEWSTITGSSKPFNFVDKSRMDRAEEPKKCYCEHKNGKIDGEGNGIMCGTNGNFQRSYCSADEYCAGTTDVNLAVDESKKPELCCPQRCDDCQNCILWCRNDLTCKAKTELTESQIAWATDCTRCGLKYVKGTRKETVCPDNSDPISTEADCKLAASALNLAFDGTGSWSTSPKGCFTSEWDGRGASFNNANPGSAHADQAPICKI